MPFARLVRQLHTCTMKLSPSGSQHLHIALWVQCIERNEYNAKKMFNSPP